MLLVQPLATPAPPVASSNAGGSDAAGGFSLSLAAGGGEPPVADAIEPAPEDQRQAIAASGSDLPPAGEIAADPQLSWIAFQSIDPTAPVTIAVPRVADGKANDDATPTPPPAGVPPLALIPRDAADVPALSIALPPLSAADVASPRKTGSDARKEEPETEDTAIAVDPALVASAIVPIVPAVPAQLPPSAPISTGVTGIPAAAIPATTAPVPTASATVPVVASAAADPVAAAEIAKTGPAPVAPPASVSGEVIIVAAAEPSTPAIAAQPIDQAAPVPAAIAPPAQQASEAQPLPIGIAQPAARIFAAAIAAAGRPARLDRDLQQNDATGLTAPVANGAIDASVIKPAAGVDNSPLDTRREDWTRQLLDRISALRDAADAGDTRIRLVPAGLGKIDVALRQQGDLLHVHFAADVAATRALLTDAQPRLAELAAERGLRLGQSGVGQSGVGQSGVGTGGQGPDQRRQNDQQTAFQPSAPPRAKADEDKISDRRIA